MDVRTCSQRIAKTEQVEKEEVCNVYTQKLYKFRQKRKRSSNNDNDVAISDPAPALATKFTVMICLLCMLYYTKLNRASISIAIPSHTHTLFEQKTKHKSYLHLDNNKMNQFEFFFLLQSINFLIQQM